MGRHLISGSQEPALSPESNFRVWLESEDREAIPSGMKFMTIDIENLGAPFDYWEYTAMFSPEGA